MLTYSIGEFKSNFSNILKRVREGEKVAIAFGRRKEIVAYLVPPAEGISKKRPLGLLDGKAQATFSADFKMDEETFLGA